MNYEVLDTRINGADKKPITLDITRPAGNRKYPVVIFCHGFKGFKDWGFFPRLPRLFAASGMAFCKFNFSHNGTTPDNLLDCPDPEAFAQNNFSKELEDLKLVVDWIEKGPWKDHLDTSEIYLMGHSMGGAVSLIYASEDKRIKKLALWATVSDFHDLFKRFDMAEWKKTGRTFLQNVRTGQQMPLDYQLYEDLEKNAARLNVLKAAEKLEIPLLLVHGEQDESVPPSSSERIYDACLHSIFIRIGNAGHTFNITHPWSQDAPLTTAATEAVENTVEFFRD